MGENTGRTITIGSITHNTVPCKTKREYHQSSFRNRRNNENKKHNTIRRRRNIKLLTRNGKKKNNNSNETRETTLIAIFGCFVHLVSFDSYRVVSIDFFQKSIKEQWKRLNNRKEADCSRSRDYFLN